MRVRVVLASWLLASLTAAAPNLGHKHNTLQPREVEQRSGVSLECLIIDFFVGELRNVGPKATAFCSSYLSVPVATVVSTKVS
jgi:hypothetical protein